MLWRQGDVSIESTLSIPERARKHLGLVLVDGALTGHSHRVADAETASIFELGDVLFWHVVAEQAEIVHQEHATICLPRGTYRVWRQREYAPPDRLGAARHSAELQRDISRWVVD